MQINQVSLQELKGLCKKKKLTKSLLLKGIGYLRNIYKEKQVKGQVEQPHWTLLQMKPEARLQFEKLRSKLLGSE
jgi:hypothetical protein